MEVLLGLVAFLWVVCTCAQGFLAYGTAYRYTKRGGNNGVALYGWMFVFNCAALVPGLGIYLWNKAREEKAHENPELNAAGLMGSQPQIVYVTQPVSQQAGGTAVDASSLATSVVVPAGTSSIVAGVAPDQVSAQQEVNSAGPVCPSCGHVLPSDSKFCEFCGAALEEDCSPAHSEA